MEIHLRLLISLTSVLSLIHCKTEKAKTPIDRYALVNQHIPICTQVDSLSPFTVGNGEFAFTVGATGLQTFKKAYEPGIPLTTLSNWGWNSLPNKNNYKIEQTYRYVDTYGRPVPYSVGMNSGPASYFRSNPHRFNLGNIGFKKLSPEFGEIDISDISNIHQLMDIWEGIVKSSFDINGSTIKVATAVDPEKDLLTVKIESGNIDSFPLCIGFDFPYSSSAWGKNGSNWDQPTMHISTLVQQDQQGATIKRQLDSIEYFTEIDWDGNAEFKKVKDHSYVLIPEEGGAFTFTCRFSTILHSNEFDTTVFNRSKDHWYRFWKQGAAVRLSKSTHPKAFELERRIILSQYLTAIQCSGRVPPQETGLTANSWFGRFHLEMHWWHAVHFGLWGRPELLEKSMNWYQTIMAKAKLKAKSQGYEGVRWPKMTAPNGVDCPSNIANFLIWQQPHPIYFCELLYRIKKDENHLDQYKDLVFQTADFMASFMVWDQDQSRYVLGPPVIPCQEIYNPEETMNPSFELSYWRFGLETAQLWRNRLGLNPDQKWQHVLDHLSSLPLKDGTYQNAETALNTFKDAVHRRDHPTLLAAYGMLPNKQVETGIMEETLKQVMATWNWQHTWGWDYTMVAMTAARVGRPDLAIEALLMDTPKNTYLGNGHNFQSDRLPLYLPGNGGLLSAVAMMATGWSDGPNTQAPGFPKDGSWVVEYEGLFPIP